MRRQSLARCPSLFLLALGAFACSKSQSDSVVVVSVTAPKDMPSVIQLRANLTLADLTYTATFPTTNTGAAINFEPAASFGLTMPPSRSGTMNIVLEAVDAESSLLATGEGDVVIKAASRADVLIALKLTPLGESKNRGLPDAGPNDAADAPQGDVASTSTGGSIGLGGAVGLGGALGVGGGIGTGGNAGHGGAYGLGGIGRLGGTIGSGGLSGSGGMQTSGGNTGTGGSTGAGGTSASVVDWCEPLQPPLHGSVTTTMASPGGRVTYSCQPGYALSNQNPRFCQGDGKWSDVEPVCCACCAKCQDLCVNTQTDNRNCGACGNVCSASAPATAQCVAGRCLATLVQEWAWTIAVDTANLYWSTHNGISRIPLGGGASLPVVSYSGQNHYLALDATTIYWSNVGNGPDGAMGAILKTSLHGGPVSPLATDPRWAGQLAVDNTNVYWTNGGDIATVPVDGSSLSAAIVSNQEVMGIAVDARHLYWTTFNSRTVMKAPLAGGAPITLAADQVYPSSIAVDSSGVYWANTDDSYSGQRGAVMKLSHGGSSPTALVSGLGSVGRIALDSTHVYWTASTAGAVRKVPKDGGITTTLAVDQKGTGEVAVDATSVYWVTRNDGAPLTGTIKRLTPK